MSFFGKNIKKIRSVRGLTQAQIADFIDVSRGVISSYEEGRAEPKIETIIKTAEVFHLTIDQLLKVNLTVNQLSGFSIPEIPSKEEVKANFLSKKDPLFNFFDKDMVPFSIASVNNNTDFELSDILFVKIKPIDYNTLMLFNSKIGIYVGKPILNSQESISVGGYIINLSDILDSYEVIGVYHQLKNQSIEDRVKILENQVLEIKNKLLKKDL